MSFFHSPESFRLRVQILCNGCFDDNPLSGPYTVFNPGSRGDMLNGSKAEAKFYAMSEGWSISFKHNRGGGPFCPKCVAKGRRAKEEMSWAHSQIEFRDMIQRWRRKKGLVIRESYPDGIIVEPARVEVPPVEKPLPPFHGKFKTRE